MKQWFGSLQQQEKVLVAGGSIALAIMLFYVALWEPLHDAVAAMEKDVAKQQPLLEWMKQAAVDVKKLKGKGGSSKMKPGQSLLSLIDTTAKKDRLGNALKRVKPDGNDKVRVWLEGASFDDTIKWVENLERSYSIHVLSLVVDRKDASGLIDSRIVFTGV